jgi:zinc protease
MYPAHPYGRQATPESVAALRRSDVLAFHAANYTAQRATVTIVGDLSRAQAEAVAAQLTADLPSRACPGEHRGAAAAGRQRAADCPSGVTGASAARSAGLRRGDPDFFPLPSATIRSAAAALFHA